MTEPAANSNPPPAIAVRDLVKNYGEVQAPKCRGLYI